MILFNKVLDLGPLFSAFGLNTKRSEKLSTFSPNAGKCGSRPATLLKRILQHRCFPVNFTKVLHKTFFYRAPLCQSNKDPRKTTSDIALASFLLTLNIWRAWIQSFYYWFLKCILVFYVNFRESIHLPSLGESGKSKVSRSFQKKNK